MPRSSQTRFSQLFSQAKAVTESGDSKLTTQTPVCCLFSPSGLQLHGHHNYTSASSPGQDTFPTIAKGTWKLPCLTFCFLPVPAMGSLAQLL